MVTVEPSDMELLGQNNNDFLITFHFGFAGR